MTYARRTAFSMAAWTLFAAALLGAVAGASATAAHLLVDGKLKEIR